MFKHSIRTLDPSRLTSSDFLDLSTKNSTTLYVADLQGRVNTEYRPCNILSQRGTRFPSGVQGFLYYHHPPPDLPTAGEVRFRITSSNDPASWASGTDFMRTDGMPWSLPTLFLAQINHSKLKGHVRTYEGLWSLLQRDELVSSKAIGWCNEIFDASPCSFHASSRFIHSLGRPFPIRFDSTHMNPHIVFGPTVSHLRVRGLFSQKNTGLPLISPYTGQLPS